MKIFLLALVLVGLCVIALGFNIIFRKNGQFPETEIENNREMKKLGIKCVSAEERALHRRKGAPDQASCSADDCSSCMGCNNKETK